MTQRESKGARSVASALCAQRQQAGFTLVELMTVVVIVGVLATLATYGVRKYTLQAKKSEAISMLTQIRAAEEAYRDETFDYLGLEKFDVWHPTSTPGDGKRGWASGTTAQGTDVFKPLGVMPTGGVIYSYAVVKGEAGDDVSDEIPTTKKWTLGKATGPFYVAMAKADLNDDGTYTYALTHSDSDEIYLDEGF